MTAVGELLLVLVLLVSAHCEVRARDPEVEEQERGAGGGAGGGRSLPPHLRATDSDPARSGYKLPYAQQQQQVFTPLLWRCCPGQGGRYHQDAVSRHHRPAESSSLDLDLDRPRSGPERTDVRGPGLQAGPQLADGGGVQNDDHRLHRLHYLHHHSQPQQEQAPPPQQQQVAVPAGGATDGALPPYPESSLLTALVVSQLQPFLQAFNRSLDQLSLQVEQLSRDVAELKGDRSAPAPSDEGAERTDAKLDEVYEQMRTVRWQVEQQRAEVDNRLHSQHAMLHYNLTVFKTDIDMKLKRHQKMLQISLQAMNTTLAELKQDQELGQDPDQNQDQDQDRDRVHIKEMPEAQTPSTPRPAQTFLDTSAIWQAVERLDSKVVNDSVKVDGLLEDLEVTSGGVQQLRRHLLDLERRVNQTARHTQVLFMETGLEVEAAKVTVLRRVEELAANLSQQERRLQDVDVDVDYLYVALYRQNNSTDCRCQDLSANVTQLESGVANVTRLANENRLALEESGGEAGAEQWGGASQWEELQNALRQVKESASREQTKTKLLEEEVEELRASSLLLQEADGRLQVEMTLLSASFASLLKDAIRHSEVLEVLLGEEVLEFLDWPLQDQEAHSIPSLKEQLLLLQEELRGGPSGGREEMPLADQPSLYSSSSDTDDWSPGGVRWSAGGGAPARERQRLLPPEARRVGGDGGDLWNLEQTVEEVQRRLLRLEETPCSCPNTSFQKEAKLQEEVTWLKRGLEEHLRVFKNVFSNADVVAAANRPLELDQLWRLLRSSQGRKEGKKRRAGGGGDAPERGGGHTWSRREATDLFSQSGSSLLFVGGAPQIATDGVLWFEPSLNRGRVYSGGVFVAPSDGAYLFVLSLDMRPGPAHLLLRRGGAGGVSPVSLQQRVIKEAGPVSSVALLPLRKGEELRLDLRAGQWAESEDNLFVGMLLHHLST
ncbi:unnamed protein product [Ophioblennius macclurei]